MESDSLPTIVTPVPIERRADTRYSVMGYMDTLIYRGNKVQMVSVLVVNLSASGVCLRIDAGGTLVSEFVLLLPTCHSAQLPMLCRVASIRPCEDAPEQQHVGARFVGMVQLPHSRRVRSSELGA
jgi:hypothetical protein